MMRRSAFLILMAVLGCRSTTGMPQARTAQVQSLSDQAAVARHEGEWDRVSELLVQAVQAAPDDAELRGELASAQFANGKRTAASGSLDRAAQLKLGSAQSNVELAQLAERMGRYALAAKLTERALELDANLVDALMMHARYAESQSKPAEAQEAYHRVLQADPDHSAAKLRLAIHEIRNGHSDQATVLLRSVCNRLETSPDDKAIARRQLGLAYGRAGRWEESAHELHQAIADRANPTADDWHALAVAYRRVNRIDEARRAGLRALQADSSHAPTHRLLTAIDDMRPQSGTRFASARTRLDGVLP